MERINSVDGEALKRGLSALPGVLKQLGFEKLRTGQDRAVMNLLRGIDTLAVFPTSAGKTACYQVPALCLKQRVLIFSPLIALMKDQVESMWRLKLSAGQVCSAQTPAENMAALSEWENGILQFLLVAPERIPNERFMEAMRKMPPDLVCIDEAHCVSNWADSFRPDYAKVGEFVALLKPKTVLAMTATCPTEVEEDIRRVIGIPNAKKIIYFPQRKNLLLSSKALSGDFDIFKAAEAIDGPVIVYCATVKRLTSLYALFGDRIRGGASCYHGQMEPAERDASQNAFMSGESRVVFATNAFGMGINKADIRGIVHADIPGSIDSVAQETGRAGRDGKDSTCVMFLGQKAYDVQKFFIENKYPPREIIERVHHVIKRNLDRDGVCRMTVEAISNACKMWSKDGAQAPISIMVTNGVIERGTVDKPVTSVRFLKEHLEENFKAYQDAIVKLGFRNEDGFYEFNQNALAEQLGLKVTKVIDTLKLLSDNGYITYVKPYRGKTCKLIGPVTKIDYDYLDRRRARSFENLEKVREYCLTPDEEKHNFLSKHFNVPLNYD